MNRLMKLVEPREPQRTPPAAPRRSAPAAARSAGTSWPPTGGHGWWGAELVGFPFGKSGSQNLVATLVLS